MHSRDGEERLLRPGGGRDARRLAELWARAFPDARTVPDRERQLREGRHYGGLEDSWLVERSGRVAAACRLHRFTQHLAGAELSMMGVAGVAVSGDARRQGLGAALCKDALRIGRDRGDVVSVLYPFRPDFYRRLGWAYVGELRSFRFSPAALPDSRALLAGVRYATLQDRPAIEACYGRVARVSHGPIVRPRGAWDVHLGTHRHGVVVERPDGVRGYALVSPGLRPVNADRVLRVAELVAEDDDAYAALLAWLSAQRDQWPQVRYDARPDERFEHRLRDPRPPRFRKPERPLWDPVATVLRGPMLRVLHVPRALEARRWGPTPGAVRLRIEVGDPELPGNGGPWTVDVEDGAARVTEGPCAAADAALSADAGTFAQIWAGELSPSAAAGLGLAAVEDPERLLDTALAVPRSFWLPDSF